MVRRDNVSVKHNMTEKYIREATHSVKMWKSERGKKRHLVPFIFIDRNISCDIIFLWWVERVNHCQQETQLF